MANYSKTTKLEQETLTKLKNLTQNDDLSFETIVNKLNSNSKNDEKFLMMLIMQLHKKCSSELLLALLYIIS